MNIKNYFRTIGGCLVAAAFCHASPARADLSYAVQPGSTITPYHEGQQSGPSEPLSGSFTWSLISIEPNYWAVYNATALDFRSASFHLTLDITPANNLESSCGFTSQNVGFAEVLNSSSLPGAHLQLVGWGSYEGSCDNPTLLTFPGLWVSSPGGTIAYMSFTLVEVPEPTAPVLLMGGLLLLACRKLPVLTR